MRGFPARRSLLTDRWRFLPRMRRGCRSCGKTGQAPCKAYYAAIAHSNGWRRPMATNKGHLVSINSPSYSAPNGPTAQPRTSERDQTVVLFEGGDSGGILISGRGIRPIPAFDASLRRTLKSVSVLLTAIAQTRDQTFGRKLSKQVVGLCNLAVEQVEDILGPLNPERAIVYQSDDGGFACGALGKPPHAFVWPPNARPSVADLVSAGAAEADFVELLQRATVEKIDLLEVFENPKDIARNLGVALSEKSAADLNVLAPSRINEIEDDVDREICGLMHALARHGGFRDSWLDRPSDVARALGVPLTDEAVQRILNRGAKITYGPMDIKSAIPWVIVPIAVVGVAAIAYAHYAEHKAANIVMDSSGLNKI